MFRIIWDILCRFSVDYMKSVPRVQMCQWVSDILVMIEIASHIAFLARVYCHEPWAPINEIIQNCLFIDSDDCKTITYDYNSLEDP